MDLPTADSERHMVNAYQKNKDNWFLNVNLLLMLASVKDGQKMIRAHTLWVILHNSSHVFAL